MDPNGDSRSAVQITNGIADGRAGIAPMADGRVAYLARTGENLNIWTMNSDGSGQKQLIRDPPFVEELRGSGDGQYFVFSAQTGKANHLFRIDTTGENLRQLTFGGIRAVDSSISPDGKFVVYDGGYSENARRRYPLFKISIDGSEPVRLTEQDCATPHYSPDGKFISCIVDDEKEIALLTSDGALVRTFSAKTRPIVNIGVRWTPDGNNLVYIVQQKDINNLWLQPIDGGPPKPLTNFTSGQIHNFAYSADGTRLFLSRGAHQQNDAVLIRPAN
jgi:Tol biopolymer transport system component